MNQFLSAPVTDAQRQRDALLGALVGLARSTVNEPKTEDTDRVLTSGLRLAADPDAAEDALRRMYHIVETEKHRVAPNCAICTMRCGNTDNYDLARLWAAPENIRALKLRLLAAVFRLAQGRPDARAQEVIDQALFRTVSFLSGILSPFCRNLVLRAQKYGDAFSKKHFTNVKEITII